MKYQKTLMVVMISVVLLSVLFLINQLSFKKEKIKIVISPKTISAITVNRHLFSTGKDIQIQVQSFQEFGGAFLDLVNESNENTLPETFLSLSFEYEITFELQDSQAQFEFNIDLRGDGCLGYNVQMDGQKSGTILLSSDGANKIKKLIDDAMIEGQTK